MTGARKASSSFDGATTTRGPAACSRRASSLCGTSEYGVGLPAPRSTENGLVTQLLGDTKRPVIVPVDNADGSALRKVMVTPGNRSSKGFRCIALAMKLRDQRPAQLGHSFDRRHDVPLKIRETEFTDIAAGSLLLHRPIAVAQQSPVSTVGQYPNPCSLRRRRVAYGVADNGRVRPHGHAICEIIGTDGGGGGGVLFRGPGQRCCLAVMCWC